MRPLGNWAKMHWCSGSGTAVCHDRIHAKGRHVCATRVSLTVEHKTGCEAYIDPEIKARLMLLAWGDEHDYAINFNETVLHVG